MSILRAQGTDIGGCRFPSILAVTESVLIWLASGAGSTPRSRKWLSIWATEKVAQKGCLSSPTQKSPPRLSNGDINYSWYYSYYGSKPQIGHLFWLQRGRFRRKSSPSQRSSDCGRSKRRTPSTLEPLYGLCAIFTKVFIDIKAKEHHKLSGSFLNIPFLMHLSFWSSDSTLQTPRDRLAKWSSLIRHRGCLQAA